MGIKENVLEGLKPQVLEQVKVGIANGKLKQPVDFVETSKAIWQHIRTNPMTCGATMTFGIKREDIDKLVREVFIELKVEVK